MNSKVAVVILNWNGVALLKQFLPSVVSHSGNADIYVADNASTDDDYAITRFHAGSQMCGWYSDADLEPP